MSIKVKVVQVPGGVQEIEIEAGETVSKVLELAEVDPDGYSLMTKGQQVSLDTPVLEEGTKIILAEDIEGN